MIAYGTDVDKPPAAPRNLSARARRLWRDVLQRYSLRVDELVLLEQAWRTLDDLDRVSDELRGAELVVPGSMKQPTAHPLLLEARGLRTVFAAHLRQLGLPDVDGTVGAAQPTQQATAARARWDKVAAERTASIIADADRAAADVARMTGGRA